MSDQPRKIQKARRGSYKASAKTQLVKDQVFGRLPPEIRNDKRLDSMALNILALLTTFVSYRLRPKRVRQHFGARPGTTGQRNGAGIKAIERAIKRLIDLDYIREVRRGRKTIHEVTFKCPDAHHIKQAWFDGRLSPHAVAALIWLRVNPGAHCREVQERFGWSKRAAQYAMAELREAGLMEKHKQLRAAGGIFGARIYTARLKAVESVESLPDAVNDVHLTECIQSGAYREGSPIRKETLLQTGKRYNHVNGFTKPSTRPNPLREDDRSIEIVDSDTIQVDSVQDLLWGWVGDWDEIIEYDSDGMWESYGDLFDEMQQYHLDEIFEVTSLSNILSTARRCAAGRINRRLPGADVACVIAHIAACILANEHNEVNDPARALQIVLAHIRNRIGGHEDGWINSMAIVAKPVLLKCHFDVFADPEELNAAGQELLPAAIKLRAMTVQRDQLGLFAKSFENSNDQIAVLKLIQRYGVNPVLAAICASIEQARRQQGLSYITSWLALEKARLANGADAVLAT